MYIRPTTSFLLGAVAGPLIGTVLRPLLREVIKGGLLIAREVQKVADEVKEDYEDMKAEASADLNRQL
jgi:Protein of unknown function (DUF5132)